MSHLQLHTWSNREDRGGVHLIECTCLHTELNRWWLLHYSAVLCLTQCGPWIHTNSVTHNLLQMQTLQPIPLPRPTESGTLGVDLESCVLARPPSDSEIHWSLTSNGPWQFQINKKPLHFKGLLRTDASSSLGNLFKCLAAPVVRNIFFSNICATYFETLSGKQ